MKGFSVGHWMKIMTSINLFVEGLGRQIQLLPDPALRTHALTDRRIIARSWIQHSSTGAFVDQRRKNILRSTSERFYKVYSRRKSHADLRTISVTNAAMKQQTNAGRDVENRQQDQQRLCVRQEARECSSNAAWISYYGGSSGRSHISY